MEVMKCCKDVVDKTSPTKLYKNEKIVLEEFENAKELRCEVVSWPLGERR
jgi:hypothetical protein